MNDMEFDLEVERSQTVVKANQLIQRSRYNLSLPEQRIILYLISKIKPIDDEFTYYYFSIQEFCKVCGINETSGTHYTSLKKSIKSLFEKSIWITLDSGEETLIKWIDRPYIQKNTGTIRLRLDELMRPYLLGLQSHFTKYSLLDVIAMRSQYSIRLFELLKSYSNLGEKSFSVDELKQRLGAELYKRWADFKRYVLDKGVSEINECTELSVEYFPEKEGRRFSKIHFTVVVIKDPMERLRKAAASEAKLKRKKPQKQMNGQLRLGESTAVF